MFDGSSITFQIRCPFCNGRLFDVTLSEPNELRQAPAYSIVIKCWKCRQKLNIENRNLVQAPSIEGYGVGV